MKNVWIIILTILSAVMAVSCGPNEHHGNYNRVLVLYSAGFNTLNSELLEDIEELKEGFIPSSKGDNVLLVASKNCSRFNDFVTKTQPALYRISMGGKKGNTVVVDTLMTMEAGTLMADAGTLRKFLEYVGDNFPSDSYGMVFSSHASGWLPEGYFNNPKEFDPIPFSQRRANHNSMVPYVELEDDPLLPAVKTIGQEVYVVDKKKYSKEIEIEDFAAAIPMHMDYILFDACLMGGVEVAYALRNVTDGVGFSQAEVLADGFDYTTLGSRLLLETPASPQKVCEDFFDIYDKQIGMQRSATISYVDCRELGDLTSVCRELFSKYYDSIHLLKQDKVQGYFYESDRHWHYDLFDIVAKAGATDEELASLKAALDKCVVYKAATPKFFQVEIKTHSGLSMYLPSAGSPYLDEFYRSLSWNEATGLVK